jgi:subtilisin family serine protease
MDQNCKEQILSEDYADFMFKYGEALDTIITNYQVCYDILNYENINVYIPIHQIPKNFIHLYGYGAYPNCYGLLDLTSIEASGVTKLRNIPRLNLNGAGVLVGIVDTGIEYTHDAFKKADGTSKIISIWDQTIQTEGGEPEEFHYGTEYNQEQLNLALSNGNPISVVPSVDENGHGTYLSGIAVGSRSDQNNFSGIVPDAELVVVKLKPAKKYIREFWRIPDGIVCYQKNDFMQAIRYMVNFANKVNRPISIIVGIGTSQGAHDERGALSTYLSALASKSGVALTIACGNEGNTGHHYYGSIPKGNDYDTVELNVGANVSGFSMELWGIAPNTFSIDILSPAGEYIPRIPARLDETREIRFIFEKTVINIDFQIVESQSGDELILIRFQNPTEGIWRFRVYASSNLDSRFHMWLPMGQFLNEKTYFLRSDPEYTLTSPGNTYIPIVVTAYDHTNQSLYMNASRGYMRTESIAPTLAAPGVNIVGPSLNNGYKVGTGTSVAAAHTAGIAAMLLEWGIVKGNYKQIDTIAIRNLLIRGAKRDPNRTYPNKEWGYGIIDLYNSFNSLRSDTGTK